MQQKYLVRGVPVFIRHLQSGDMAVWHPFNLETQAVVEPICRGRGYWKAEYNNWIIKASWVDRVRADLSRIGRVL